MQIKLINQTNHICLVSTKHDSISPNFLFNYETCKRLTSRKGVVILTRQLAGTEKQATP